MTRETITASTPVGPVLGPHSTSTVEAQRPVNDAAAHVNAASLESDLRWQAVQRIISSKSFAKASRLSEFLLYICERTLQGRTDEITEQQIGVRVFGRPAHYNPGDDNIVRGTARLLRQRLELYYQEEGYQDALHIVVPRGAYIPVFETAGEDHPPADPTPVPAGNTSHQATLTHPATNRYAPVIPLLLSFALGAAVVFAIQHATHRRRVPPSPSAELWHALFPPGKRTLIIAGDAGVNMFDNFAKRQVGVNEYSARTYLSSSFAQTPSGYDWAPLATRAYVGVQDLKLITSLVRLTTNIFLSITPAKYGRKI